MINLIKVLRKVENLQVIINKKLLLKSSTDDKENGLNTIV